MIVDGQLFLPLQKAATLSFMDATLHNKDMWVTNSTLLFSTASKASPVTDLLYAFWSNLILRYYVTFTQWMFIVSDLLFVLLTSVTFNESFIFILTVSKITSGKWHFGILTVSGSSYKPLNSFLNLYSPTPIIPDQVIVII